METQIDVHNLCIYDFAVRSVYSHFSLTLSLHYLHYQNSRHEVNGDEVPLTKGKIELQSESAEVFYKDIKIRPIEALPNEFKK